MGSWVSEQVSVYLRFGARGEWEEPRYGVGRAQIWCWNPGSAVSGKSESLLFLTYKSSVIRQLCEDHVKKEYESVRGL